MSESFGELLRRRRDELRITQWDLRDQTGLSQTYISKLEHDGVEHPSLDTLTRLSKALNIELDTMRIALGWVVIVRGEEVALPVLGRVPADSVRLTSEQEGVNMAEIEVTRGELGNARAPYALEVSGDCWKAIGILNGDVVIVDAADGRPPKPDQIVVVRVGHEVTLKRWVDDGSVIKLQDGDGTTTHTIDPTRDRDVEVLAFYVTYRPLAPR